MEPIDEKATRKVSVRLPPRLYARLHALARVGGLSFTSVVVHALEAVARPDARRAAIIRQLVEMADRRGL